MPPGIFYKKNQTTYCGQAKNTGNLIAIKVVSALRGFHLKCEYVTGLSKPVALSRHVCCYSAYPYFTRITFDIINYDFQENFWFWFSFGSCLSLQIREGW